MYPTLYHGTDLKIASLTKEERVQYKNYCMEAARYLWEFFRPYYERKAPSCISNMNELKALLPADKFPYLYSNLLNSLCCFDAYLNGSRLYQYDKDVVYLCSDIDRAARYAQRAFAGGEMGLIAFRMIEASQALGVDLTDAPNSVLQSIQEVKMMEGIPDNPVIIPVSTYDRSKVFMEDGKEMSDEVFADFADDECSSSFKYTGALDFNLDDCIFLKRHN